ncbi:MAG TPA: flagellar motor switch protein FliN [Acidimicrobiales bacterium]|nr:flagellar motor switch protein FliN [Acidimicrobiales bacterium]
MSDGFTSDMDQVESVAQPASFEELGPGESPGAPRDLRLLADINVELSVELGRSKLPMRKLLSLVPGSVIDLDRPADGGVDVLVNGRVVARGEIVIVDGEIGVRVTEILNQ